MKAILPKFVRWPIYLLTAVLVFWTAWLVENVKTKKQRDIDVGVMKAQIEAFWDLEKEKINKINQRAEDFAQSTGLAVGDELPIRLLAEKNEGTIEALSESKNKSIITEYKAGSGDYFTKAISIITIKGKVPEKGEYYAYGGIEHNKEMFGNIYSLYPEDAFARERVSKALKKFIKQKSEE
jgi:hypothetical protein